jgi:phosphoglycerate dehydrogenase-like enzyme
MDTINVLVSSPFPEECVEKMRGVSPRLAVTYLPLETGEELPDSILDVQVLYTRSKLPRPEQAPALRWVQLYTSGVDHVLNHPLLTDTEVTITTSSGIHATSMAEYALAQMLSFSHHLPAMLGDKISHRWPSDRVLRAPGELRGATLGIVGYGSIGREIARLAQAFGMRVLAVKRSLRQLEDAAAPAFPGMGDPGAEIPDRIYPPQALRSFLHECDYVVITVPLTRRTLHLFDGAALAAMKSGSFLINISRGDVVDEAALIQALADGHLAGAALDVFHTEPLPADDPLWDAPNLVISPHIAGLSPHLAQRAADLFTDNLRRFISGEPLLNVFDRKRGY